MKIDNEKFKTEFDITPLTDIMARLRSENGCAWDKEQTHKSLRRYLIEEVAEALEAIDEEDSAATCDELGDILLQIVFHAKIAEEEGRYNMQDIIDGISAKMIRRHPHVFGDVVADNSETVVKNWEEIKSKEETHKNRKIMDGVPKHLNPLLKAQKIQEKAAKVGFNWDNVEGIWNKVNEEIIELKDAILEKNQENMEKEAGDVLFSLINLLEWYKISGENALRRTNAKFIKRFNEVETAVAKSSKKWEDFSLIELDQQWEKAKENEKD